MKNSIFALALLSIAPLHADVGCMERSRHAYLCYYTGGECCTYDNKTLYYVKCSCPCWRYRQTPRICTQCRHLREPQELPVIFK